MESCGMSFIKYLLFVFNLVFAISGLGIIIAGGLVLRDVSDFEHFTTSELLGPPIVLIVAGSIVFIIAFLGCFGAIRESYNLLLAFAGLLVVVFIMELAVGIAAAEYRGDFESILKKTLESSMANYTQNDVEQKSWDGVQKNYKCCGVEKPTDWQLPSGDLYPKSCCYEPGRDDKDSPAPKAEDIQEEPWCRERSLGNYRYTKGCFQKLKSKIDSNAKVLIGVGIGIAFIEVVGIVLACWLAYTIKEENEPHK